RVEFGSAALELGREGRRQRHRGHRLLGPRVGDRLANPVLRYPRSLHQLNLIALVLGRRKLRLPAAALLDHLRLSPYGKNPNIRRVRYSFDWTSSFGADAITHCRPADWVDAAAVVAGALPCNREFRAEYECRVELCLNALIVKLVITKTCQYIDTPAICRSPFS